MLSVLDILNKTKDFFEKKAIENPRLNAEWILSKGLGCKRLDLYLRFEEKVPEERLLELRDLVKRRGKGEPLQYILGEMPFMDLSLKIDFRALIPRPETEELIDRLLKLWGENYPRRVLDLGTGSGALALAVGYYCKDTKVVGVDINGDTLALAQENGVKCGLEDRVSFLLSDWFSEVEGKFDWIIANPPYLTEEEWQRAQIEVKDYEPKGALVAVNEGLADLQRILNEAGGYLNPGGGIILETGIGHHERLKELVVEFGYGKTESWKDLSGRDRFFVAFL